LPTANSKPVSAGVRVTLATAAIVVAVALRTPLQLAILGAVLMASAPIFGADLRATARRLAPMWLLFASIVLVHAWTNPANHTPFWGPFYTEGLTYGLVTALRLFDFVVAADVVVLSAGVPALVRWARGINSDFGLMLAMTLGVIPVLAEQMRVTLAAQRARGLDTDASLMARFRAYLAVLIPVIVKALVRAHAMAGLLLVRGYGRAIDGSAGPHDVVGTKVGFSFANAQTVALAPVNFSAWKGAITGLTGPNGSGKTVLLDAVAGLAGDTVPGTLVGELRFDGRLRTSPESPPVAYALQDPGVHLFETILEEVAFPYENAGLTPEAAEQAAHDVLAVYGVGHLAGRGLREISGGERQKVALAATEASTAGIVVFDEPFEQLDTASAAALGLRMRQMADAGATILVATRRGESLAGIADDAIALKPSRAAAPASPLPPVSLAPRAADAPAILQLTGATYRFPEGGGVEDATLSAHVGEIVALVGPNGAGKTTLLSLVLGAATPQMGAVSVTGLDVAKLTPPQRAALTGVVFQDPDDQLFNETVASEVGWGLKVRRVPAEQIATRVSAVLDEVGLADVAETNPHELSRSKRQLVALASALVGEPRLIVLDEPTTALDDEMAAIALAAVVRRVAAGASALIATHDSRLADAAATTLVRLEAGRIVSSAQDSEPKE
jgi:energy-coupling factor transport system ATP-binding protein